MNGRPKVWMEQYGKVLVSFFSHEVEIKGIEDGEASGQPTSASVV